MKVSDYLPKIYNKNSEMLNIINSEEEEFETHIKLYIENAAKDNFPKTATETGIEKYESMLGIQSDKDTETLDFRRKRVLNRLVSKIPFTETYFVNRMNEMLGEGNWSYTIDYNNYTIDIQSTKPGHAWYQEVLKFIEDTLPCNMVSTITLYTVTWEYVYNLGATWKFYYDNNITWQQILNDDWSMSAIL